MKPISDQAISAIFSSNILALMQKEGLNQTEFARQIDVDKASVSGWLKGGSFPTKRNLETIIKRFSVTSDDILSENNGLASGRVLNSVKLTPVPTARIPLLGCIPAGEPLDMCEMQDTIEIPVSWLEGSPRLFSLQINGDSMNNRILDRHLAIIDPDEEVHNGDVAAVNVNGFDATIKIYHKTANSLILSPDSTNPEHKDIVIDETNPDAPNVRILGKMVNAMYPRRG